MKRTGMSRRGFLAGVSVGTFTAFSGTRGGSDGTAKLAIHGGRPVRHKSFGNWPIWDRNDEAAVLDVLRSGNWFRGRGNVVEEFEQKYARMTGANGCMATVNGTNALLTALRVLDIGVGDEVIVPPYTFVATISVVFNSNALPVFADVDPETFQIDPDSVEKRITSKTRAIIPVHILGGVADMDRINAIAKKHGLKVIEDACQAHMAEWRGRHVGTLGDLGCFSFQNSKNLPCGEGGAVIGADSRLTDKCHSFTNCGRSYGSVRGSGFAFLGTNRRMTQYQAAILMGQMKNLEANAARREENARYLRERIEKVPGITAQKGYDGQTRSAYHLFAFTYDKEQFGGVSRGRFLDAMRGEGMPVSSGYRPLNKEGIIEDALNSKNITRVFSKERLQRYRRENECPANDRLCQRAVWMPQYVLLGDESDMDDIARAIEKVYENRRKLV